MNSPDINFLSTDEEELTHVLERKELKTDLDNSEIIQQLTERKLYYEGKISLINATITLLQNNPNYARIHKSLNEV